MPRSASPRARLRAIRALVPTALAVTVVLVVSSLLVPEERAGSRRVVPTGTPVPYDWSAPRVHRPNPAGFSLGVTHTQYSIDDWGDDAALASAKRVLTATATYQNQHIFGWGALNPQPRPGVFDWASLDRRMALVDSTGGAPVITLCCAPDWMKGGRAGETDWERLHVAPRPEHYRDFAALAVAVARRYPRVRHFLVWNEMKGFWDNARNRWNYEAYTELYNAVYDALKAAVPGVAVGGPYVVVDVWANPTAGGRPSTLVGGCGTVDRRSLDVLEYWLRNAHVADFVAVDGGTVTRDAGEVGSTTVRSAVFAAITRWVRDRTDLPVWWSEFHVGQSGAGEDAELVAGAVAATLHMVDQRAAVALMWQPQRAPEEGGADHSPALWTTTEHPGGGQPLALAGAVARMQEILATVADDDPVSWPMPDVGVLHGRAAILAVNTSDGPHDVRVLGIRLRLAPFEVRYQRLPAGAPPAPPSRWSPTADECLREQPRPTP
jgi:hypothetical protein